MIVVVQAEAEAGGEVNNAGRGQGVAAERERGRGWIFPFKAINSCQCVGSELSWAGLGWATMREGRERLTIARLPVN